MSSIDFDTNQMKNNFKIEMLSDELDWKNNESNMYIQPLDEFIKDCDEIIFEIPEDVSLVYNKVSVIKNVIVDVSGMTCFIETDTPNQFLIFSLERILECFPDMSILIRG